MPMMDEDDNIPGSQPAGGKPTAEQRQPGIESNMQPDIDAEGNPIRNEPDKPWRGKDSDAFLRDRQPADRS